MSRLKLYLSNIMSQIQELANKCTSELLQSMGFEHTLTVTDVNGVVHVNISSADAKFIIGGDGSRLDDMQYLINRMIQKELPDATRIKLDCDSYRARTEEKLMEKAVRLAQKVLRTGDPLKLNPLNAYYRRLVHNKLQEIEGIVTESEKGDARYKKITIRKA